MPFIIPANSAVSGGFDVDNSVRLDGTSAYLKFTSSAGNRRTWTYSTWVKRSVLTNDKQNFISSYNATSDAGYTAFRFQEGEVINLTGWSTDWFTTNRVFRDTSSWYHIVLAVDTTNSTAGNRLRLYVNGVEETSFSQSNNPDQNEDLAINVDGEVTYIAAEAYTSGGSRWFNGYIAETVLIDGQQLTPTSFGEFDEDSGIWKPKSVSGLTAGTNGFYLDFKDSANLGNDAFGGTDLTEVNLTVINQATDTCTNNFATLNPLAKGANVTLTEGNLQFTSNNRYGTVGTFGVSNGKWYWEVKVVDAGSDIQVGIFQDGGNYGFPNAELGKTSQGWSVISIGGNRLHSLSQSSYGGAAFSDGDILMVALDMDNGKWYMGKNNSWFDSGNPATSSSPAHTGITGTIFPAIATYTESQSGSINYQFNFGSPPYAISSGNTDADGYGNFEYAVPSGYFSLNTKNLAEYG